MVNRLLKVLESAEIVAESVDRAKDLVEKLTGSRQNACAATSSELLNRAGILKGHYYLCSQLSSKLERLGCTKITKISELQPGDIAFSKDANNIEGPDHVYILVGTPSSTSPYNVTVVDNYSLKPHTRNLGPGPRTPFAYAWRLPGNPVGKSARLSPQKVTERLHFLANMRELYAAVENLGMNDAEKQVLLESLNKIRWQTSLRDFKLPD